jgi:hypothetical protein
MAHANFLKHLLFLFLGLMMLWGVHILELSVVSFFHFLLDHRLAVIEGWVFDKAWEMILVAKILPILFLLKFVYLKSLSRHPLRDQFLSGIKVPSYEIWVTIVVSLILTALFTKPTLNPGMTQWDGFKNFINAFSLFIFFMCDVFYIDALERMYPIATKLKILRNFVYSLISFLIVEKIFLHALNLTPFFGMTLFFLLMLHHYKKNWLETSCYLFFFLIPAITLLGLDFIWKDTFSVFIIKGDNPTLLFLGIYISCIFYVSYFNRAQKKNRKRYVASNGQV